MALKIIEIIATSTESFSDATHNAVIEAAKTVKNIQFVFVKEMTATVEDNLISFGVNAKIAFAADGSDELFHFIPRDVWEKLKF